MKLRKPLFLTLALCLLTACSVAEQPVNAGEALDEFLKGSKKPAVLKFYADWCASCKEYAPAYDKVSKELGSTVDFYKIDIDQKKYKKLIKEIKISRIPDTIFVSEDRNNVTRQIGPLTTKELKTKILELQTAGIE